MGQALPTVEQFNSILIYTFSQEFGVPKMKKTILLSYVSLLLTFALAWFVCAQDKTLSAPEPSGAVMAPLAQATADRPAATQAAKPAKASTSATPKPSAEPTAAPLPEAAPEVSPAPERLRVKCGEEVYDVETQKYLVGVVAAEMPAAFEPEALKAQAVAARSYAIYCAASGRHAGADADVCTDSGCCQAWISEETMRKNWGESFEANYGKISAAVQETEGEYLVYGGAAIFAAFHSSSAGRTEDCGAIWNSVPYLISVESPETEEEVPNFISRVELSPLDFRDAVLHAESGADFSGEESGWIADIVRDESGRVDHAVIGGVSLRGTELRSLFSLRSTNFTLEYDGANFIFTVSGFGHGVGMSQYGAAVMAAEGAGYREILAHYYPGTELAGRA